MQCRKRSRKAIQAVVRKDRVGARIFNVCMKLLGSFAYSYRKEKDTY